MKNIAKAIVFLALVSAAATARAAVFQISIALPPEALVTSDLDARDAFNRPVPNSHMQSQFVEIWSRSLNKMILNSLTPMRLKVMAILNSAWDGFAGAVRATSEHVWHAITSWLAQRKSDLRFWARSLPLSIPIFVEVSAPAQTGSAYSFLIQFVLASTFLLR